MNKLAASFLALAVLAILFGIADLSDIAVDVGRALIVVFLILSVISFIGSLLTNKNHDKFLFK